MPILFYSWLQCAIFPSIDWQLLQYCYMLWLQIYKFFLDSVRYLMQYIDELVFKCLTLECDLGSAVNCLIMQPGQFAGTWIYHVEFGWVMLAFSLQNAFHYFSEYIQSDSEFWVVYYALIPLWKKHISKKKTKQNKRERKKNSGLLFKLPSQLVCA